MYINKKMIKNCQNNYLIGLKEEEFLLGHKHQNITHMTDRRINKICTLLFSRINKLKNIIDEK